jgi:predicted AlkP superfamily pyrophosphatase or phosphodiesterase
MAGHKGDGVYWFREGFGFTTYVEPGQNDADRLKPVLSLNADIKARFAAKAPSWSYENDYCRTLEDDFKVGETSVHSTVPPAKFTFDNSPLLDDVTIDGALYLINQQKLGAGQSTDILAISLSATDRIGHNYGTQGPEMCEQLFRLDANLQRLFDALQDVPGGAVVVLTADHGGADVPERSAERGFPQARRADRGILTRLNESLKAQFKLETDPAEFDGWGLFIVGKDHIRLPDPLRGKVAEAAVAFLSKEPDVAGVFTLDDLLKSPPPPRGKSPEEFTLKERATLSAVAGRSTDVILILQPGIAPLSAKPGGAISTHGSAWDYDRRVPILFWWPGATGQERFFPIDTTDIGPTLAHLIGVKPPADVDGRCLDLGGFDVPACPAEPAPVAAAQPAPEPVAATPATKGVRWPWTKPRT